MSRTKGIALPGKSMEEATRNAQKDFLTKDQKTVDTATVTPMTCNALRLASTGTRASRSMA